MTAQVRYLNCMNSECGAFLTKEETACGEYQCAKCRELAAGSPVAAIEAFSMDAEPPAKNDAP